MRRTIGAGPLAAFVLLLAAGARLDAQTVVAELSVHAGPHERVDVPVSAALAGVSLRLESGELRLYETTGQQSVPVSSQLRPGRPDQLAWILGGRTPANATRTFQLRVEPVGNPAQGRAGKVQVADDGESLQLSVGGRPALEYRYELMPVPEGVRDDFSLSGFIHPLYSPQGEVLTRIQPPDHYHHYGIWNPWTRTEFEGRTVDFWNVGGRQGRVLSDGVVERLAGDVFGGFRSVHNHIDHRAEGGDRVAMREQWDVTVWNVPEQGGWLIDFASTLNPATDQPLTIKEYRYQGFALRATERWNDQNSRLLTSEGLDKSNANATRARWIDVNGETGAQPGTSGILFMTNPGNFNYPEQLRIWPTGQNRGVENVFVNFNPAQDRDWELLPGRSYSLKYRMFVYDGSVTPDQAERLWRDFAEPPRVDVTPVAPAR